GGKEGDHHVRDGGGFVGDGHRKARVLINPHVIFGSSGGNLGSQGIQENKGGIHEQGGGDHKKWLPSSNDLFPEIFVAKGPTCGSLSNGIQGNYNVLGGDRNPQQYVEANFSWIGLAFTANQDKIV
ncbi:hypothetical protein KI387_044442, partial [Taxus chinensis]